MEPVSFAFGVFGALDQAIRLVDDLILRWRAESRNPLFLDNLTNAYADLRKSLQSIQNRFHDQQLMFTPSDDVSFHAEMVPIKQTLDRAAEELTALKEGNQRHVARRFISAKSQKEKLQQLEESATNAAGVLDKWNNLLIHTSVVKNIASQQSDVIMQEHRRGADELAEKLTSRMDNGCIRTFKPSFIVPPIPRQVLHDYSSCDAHGNAITAEGRLKQALLKIGSDTRFVSATDAPLVGAIGMGGVGKSCALRGLSKDPEIRARFSGGVYFLCLGMDKKRFQIINELVLIMTMSTNPKLNGEEVMQVTQVRKCGATEIEKAVQICAGWFANAEGPCLFLVDDIWLRNGIKVGDVHALTALTQCRGGSALCFTTRFSDFEVLAETVPFRAHDSYGYTPRKILLKYAGVSEGDLTPQAKLSVRQVLGYCGGLPVALAIAGSSALLLSKGGVSGDQVWEEVQQCRQRFGDSIVRGQGPGGNLVGYKCLCETISASLEVVDGQKEQYLTFQPPLSVPMMFQALCVLEKQQWVPVWFLAVLWQLDRPEKALQVARLLEQGSLLDSKMRDGILTFGLHDLLNDCARAEAMAYKGERYWRHLAVNNIDLDIIAAVLHEDYRETICRCMELLLIVVDVIGLLQMFERLVTSNSQVNWVGIIETLSRRRMQFGTGRARNRAAVVSMLLTVNCDREKTLARRIKQLCQHVKSLEGLAQPMTTFELLCKLIEL